MKTLFLFTLAATAAFTVLAAETTLLQDKTLVAWVAPANLTQRGGGVLTIQTPNVTGEDFDGIVFGEIAPAKWMAGSEFWHRTRQEQSAVPAETADAQTLVQIAIAYAGQQVTVYRDGKLYSRYEVPQPFTFDENSLVVLGLRHLSAGVPGAFAGDIEEARIYDVALSGETLATLRPHQPGPIAPFAHWTFANGKVEELAGRFPRAELLGGAVIADGKLRLNGQGACLVAWRTGETVKLSAAPAGPQPSPVSPGMKTVGIVTDDGERDVRDMHNFKERTYDLGKFLPADTLIVRIETPYQNQGWGANYAGVQFSSDGKIRDLTLPAFSPEEKPYIFDQSGSGNDEGRRFLDNDSFFSYVFNVKGAKEANLKIKVGNNFRITVGKNIPKPEKYISPIHYRPEVGVFGDPVPFFWKGEYHNFYLHGGIGKVPWEHIVSTDLVHWKELPPALVSDGGPTSPDGLQMFTGSVVEKDGVFHAFYTGHNNRNPEGLEFVMHATSPDAIHWTKHPGDILRPDGVIYRIGKKADPGRDNWIPIQEWNFRDPYVFFNEQEKCYWMLFLGDDAQTGRMVQGLATSHDLVKWEFQPPLNLPEGQECPDLFKIGDTWFLTGGGSYYFSKNPRGEFKSPPVQNVIDNPAIYAGKRMFDGKRHVWTGWISDCSNRDGGGISWGGTQCLPRELFAGPDGQLYQRPVDEVTAVFTNNVLKINKPRDVGPGFALETPDHYMLQCQMQLDPEATLTITMRQQADGTGGYNFVLRPKTQRAELNGSGFCYDRRCTLDTGKPIKFQAFVQGTIIECFINDQFAYTCRAYNYPKGLLGFKVEGGQAQVLKLNVKTNK
jgi:sucrose-6-phosphate hydrolase SacC (GH32 family)